MNASWMIIFVAGCATAGGGRFPSAEELRKLEESPAPTRTTNGTDRELDGWALAGPLPDRVGTVPHAATGSWEGLLVQAAEARRGVVFASESMSCVAREAGRFYLANQALPSPRLSGFMANRCGSPVTDVSLSYSGGKAPSGTSEAEVFEHWRPTVEKALGDQLKGGPLLGGLWFGREGDRAVVMLALQPRRVELEPLSFRPSTDGKVVLRGELLVPADRVEALINQGPYGFARCTNDDQVKLPRFSVTCQASPNDDVARIEMGAFPPGRITGPIAIDLSVWPAREPDSLWHRPASGLAHSEAGDLTQQVLGLVNEARRQASLSPLALANAESVTAGKVAPHYFAASLGAEPATIADQVVLGLRAGWEIEGAVRLGHFAAGVVLSTDPAELVAATLDRPSGRETLLTPAARQLAVGAFAADRALAGVVSTYELTDERDADVERVLARVAELRQNVGRPAPQIMKELQSSAAEEARKITRGRSPRGALESLMQVVAQTKNGAVHGWAVEYTAVESIELPKDMLQSPSLRMAVAVSSYKPPREPWTHFVAVFVALDEVMAMAAR